MACPLVLTAHREYCNTPRLREGFLASRLENPPLRAEQVAALEREARAIAVEQVATLDVLKAMAAKTSTAWTFAPEPAPEAMELSEPLVTKRAAEYSEGAGASSPRLAPRSRRQVHM